MATKPRRELRDLAGIGPAMLGDFRLLRIESVEQLAQSDPFTLYKTLCRRTGARQDPCVLDTFRCAIEQARDPKLAKARRNWGYWTAKRTEDEVAFLERTRRRAS